MFRPGRRVAEPQRRLDVSGRIDLLRAIPEFATLPGPALAALALALDQETYRSGQIVFSQGHVGDRLLIVGQGQGELSVEGKTGPVPLATLGPGEMTGVMALLSESSERTATLRASTPMHLLGLQASRLREVLNEHPETRAAFEAHAERLSVSDFLKRVGPFGTLDGDTSRWLASRLIARSVRAGEILMREGEPGASCFLIRSGRFEAIAGARGGREHVLSTAGAGSVLGEVALLSDAKRSATVRAITDAEVLELNRSDLEAVADQDSAVARGILQLFRLRDCPRQAPGVQVSERGTPDGGTVTILKHPVHLTYFRLSERGRLIWDLMDGEHNLRALTLAFVERFGEFRPDVVMDIAVGLARTQMIELRQVQRGLGSVTSDDNRFDRLLSRIHAAMTKQMALRNVDALLTAAYRRGVHLLFTRAAQVALGAVALAGLVAYFIVSSSLHHALTGKHREALLLALAAAFVATFLHEAGHAFAVKAFGRTVNRAGVGWYWFGPVAFVDTSDMWLGTRRERILVSVAGPYTDVLFAGCASLAALLVDGETPRVLLWATALPSYLAVLFNFNPLLEYDGYHILSDMLNRPNLRAEALAWLGSRFPAALHNPRELRAHLVDLAYGAGAIVYIVVMGGVVLVVYRAVLQGWVALVLPADVARDLAWVLAPALSLLAILGLLAELRAHRRTPM